jgi:hypothetical protein
MRSLALQTALTEFLESAAGQLRADLAAGAEVPFELDSRSSRRRVSDRLTSGRPGARAGGRAGTPLYCYRALTGTFIADRQAALERLPTHAEAARLLEGFDGLERYLASVGVELKRPTGRARARAALIALLQDACEEQTDFELRPERLHAALERLERSAFASAGELTLVATLHGLTIASAELQLTKGLTLAHCDALAGLPERAIAAGEGETGEHLVVVFTAEEDEVADGSRSAPHDGTFLAREVLRDLLRALRLFGDGRVTLGTLAWSRVGAGAWSPLALGSGGRPHGMLVVTAEQEDELRAFCNLVSRRAPEGNELAWALRRFELGCERSGPYEALTDHVLALRALLEPEGPASGLLAGRLATLCATPEHRIELTERMVRALAVERAVIAGSAVERAGGLELAREVSDHLRALLRDVICGHLTPDLVGLADELLLEDEDQSAQELFGDTLESEEILDLLI